MGLWPLQMQNKHRKHGDIYISLFDIWEAVSTFKHTQGVWSDPLR